MLIEMRYDWKAAQAKARSDWGAAQANYLTEEFPIGNSSCGSYGHWFQTRMKNEVSTHSMATATTRAAQLAVQLAANQEPNAADQKMTKWKRCAHVN
jgi:hypothetical protein